MPAAGPRIVQDPPQQAASVEVTPEMVEIGARVLTWAKSREGMITITAGTITFLALLAAHSAAKQRDDERRRRLELLDRLDRYNSYALTSGYRGR